jgi:hypothetical protein
MFGKRTAFCLSGLLWVNYKAELRVTCYLTGGDPKSAPGRNAARKQTRIPEQNSVRKL